MTVAGSHPAGHLPPRTPGDDAPAAPARFAHETFGYRSDREFLDGVVGFVRDGLARNEVVVVAEPRPRLDLLRDALGEDAAAVEFHDMAEVGANPARIIAVWQDALARTTASGRGLRGVGEPAYAGRSAAEYDECHLHELLLNAAFDGGPAWRLLCPYDERALPPAVSAGSLGTHPLRTTPEGPVPTGNHPPGAVATAFAAALPVPREPVLRGEYGSGDVPAVRRTVASFARTCGLDEERVEALELAASELATNSLRHGGGSGTVAMWAEPGAAVLEFTDAGHVEDPLVGRRQPPLEQLGGRGVYLVNQLCDLVQLRSSAGGTTVRVTTWL